MKNKFRFLIMTCFLLIASFCLTAVPNVKASFENKTREETRTLPRVIDDTGTLSKEEVDKLNSMADEISERLQCDVAICMIPDLATYGYGNSDSEVQAFADDLFDYEGYGLGEKKDGVMLAVSQEDRKRALSTHGKVEKMDLKALEAEFLSLLSDDKYYEAFEAYMEAAEAEVTNVKTLPVGKYVLYSIIAGVIIGFIVVTYMKSKLNSVAFQDNATVYTKNNSMNVTTRNDFFLYRTIDRRAKPKEDSGSHTSSSGESHGGSSGSF